MTELALTPSLAGSTLTLALERGGRPASRADFFTALSGDHAFRALFTRALATAPFDAFFWEMPGTTRARQSLPCEMVLVRASGLGAAAPDPTSFASHFAATPGSDVAMFPSLGGDATLVVPTPRAPHEAYAHLATFVRRAPVQQVDALWAAVADAVRAELDADPLWVSTAGLGVPWLHVRLDTRPKYYRHAPYKAAP